MKKGKKKKDRSWIPDAIIEMGGVLLEIILFIPRVIIRIVKDAI
ncbi:hypothetical protein [Planomicrobium sp. CPCC 101110]|nr:hypothetical protein [Planomicrobium sp. CPCC 101110]